MIFIKRLLSLYRFFKFNKPPILIGGCGRSGTSLLLSILGSHPSIFAIPFETEVFIRNRRGGHFKWKHFIDLYKIIVISTRYKILARHSRWCEKTPRNIRFVEALLQEFSGKVKFIHIIRDGRDIVTSFHPAYQGYYVSPQRWVRDVRLGLKFVKNPNLLTVKYEDMVLEFDDTFAQIFDFLDEKKPERLSDFHRHTNVNDHEAWRETLKGLDSNSIGRWKDNKHEMRVKEFLQFEEAVKLMKELNYL